MPCLDHRPILIAIEFVSRTLAAFELRRRSLDERRFALQRFRDADDLAFGF
jgi:hypothetical protein